MRLSYSYAFAFMCIATIFERKVQRIYRHRGTLRSGREGQAITADPLCYSDERAPHRTSSDPDRSTHLAIHFGPKSAAIVVAPFDQAADVMAKAMQ